MQSERKVRGGRKVRRLLVWVVAVGLSLSVTPAADVEKKWRLGAALGVYQAQGSVRSDSANTLALVDGEQVLVDFYLDPRNDSGALGKLDINGGGLATVYGQYALSKIFIVEASLGYQESDVGDVEVQAQFTGLLPPMNENLVNRFEIFRVNAGTLTRVPLQVTFLGRFRPRAKFNPYLGAGLGYSFIGFEPSPEFNELSVNMDSSLGGQMTLDSSFNSAGGLNGGTMNTRDLAGAHVEAPDSFEWHVAGGAELSFKRKWVLFLDARWISSTEKMTIGFNDQLELGVSVPQLQDYEANGLGNRTYGAVLIERGNGGLIDGGQLVPRPTESNPSQVNCDAEPQRCFFQIGNLDGRVDPGRYYAQGGSFRYTGLSVSIGVRYTF